MDGRRSGIWIGWNEMGLVGLDRTGQAVNARDTYKHIQEAIRAKTINHGHKSQRPRCG